MVKTCFQLVIKLSLFLLAKTHHVSGNLHPFSSSVLFSGKNWSFKRNWRRRSLWLQTPTLGRDPWGRPGAIPLNNWSVFFGKPWENVGTIWRKPLEMEVFPWKIIERTRCFWWFSIFDCQIQRARGWSRAVFESSRPFIPRTRIKNWTSKKWYPCFFLILGGIWHGGLWWLNVVCLGWSFEIFELNHSKYPSCYDRDITDGDLAATM